MPLASSQSLAKRAGRLPSKNPKKKRTSGAGPSIGNRPKAPIWSNVHRLCKVAKQSPEDPAWPSGPPFLGADVDDEADHAVCQFRRGYGRASIWQRADAAAVGLVPLSSASLAPPRLKLRPPGAAATG